MFKPASSQPFSRPRQSRRRLAAAAAVLVVGLTGCSSAAPGTAAQSTLPGFAPSSAAAPTEKTPAATAGDADHTDLLLSAADLSDGEDTFAERSKESEPKGVPGASAFFVNAGDNRAIIDTFVVHPDAATATAALHQAAAALPTLVTGGASKPAAVGTDGVMSSGTHPQDAKAVTILYFTEGRALVRLEFQSAAGDATTDAFVTTVGKMQQIALRVGLPVTR